MARINYRMDYEGTNDLMRSEEMRHALTVAAARGREAAEQAAEGGEYRIESSPQGSGRWRDRAEARLIADREPHRGGQAPLHVAIDAIEQP